MSASSYHILSRLVAAAVNVSQKSAKILRDVKMSGELNVQEKAANDYVTRADFLSQLNIIKSLEKLFPKLKFCGEEGDLKDDYNDLETTLNQDVLVNAKDIPDIYQSVKEEDLFVWVDPLDGTKEYTQGPEFSHEVTVLIGVSWKGKPVAGVLNQPFYKLEKQENNSSTENSLGRVLWGIVGLGAFDSIKGKLNIQNNAGENKKRRIITTRSHITDILKRDIESIPNSQLIHAGGAGFKILSVIEGNADCYLYPRDGTKRWDTCAPEAILRSINGNLTDIFGNEYSYSKSENSLVENCYGIVATLHDPPSLYINHLSDELKKNVLTAAEKLKPKK